MAITRDTYNRGVLVPKLPDHSITQPNYKPQTNTDPSSYYTTALGFLPVDTRYLSNTTNSLAYNSMADVIFNRQAHKERWKNSGWDWLVDVPIIGDAVRVPIDTALLFKDTVINPTVQGVINDGWSGLLRGLSTATMNSLINLGNTLDVVSNPIKGLVLEGGEGLVKGFIGDEHGRKQYDYTDYVNTGNGFVDLVASLALEIVTDPLNWFSFGSKQLISSGAKTLSGVATDSITKAIDMAITAGKNSVDDVAEALVKNVKYFDNTTAKAFANQMVDESTGVITKASADTVVNNFSDNLTKTIKRLGTSGDLSEDGINSLASQLLQGKSTRAKASLFNRTPFSVADQSVVGRYLQDLDISKLPTKYMAGVKTYKGVQNVERALRWAGGTGFYPVIGTNELRKHISKRINNARALKDMDYVIKHVQDFDADLRFDYSGKIIEDTKTALDIDVVEVNAALQTIKDDYMDRLLSYKTYSLRSKTIQNLQGRTLDKINKKLSNLLSSKGITDLDSYINYLKNADAAPDVLEPFNALRRMLTTDVSDPTVLRQYRAGITQFQQLQESITEHAALYPQSTVVDELRAVSEANIKTLVEQQNMYSGYIDTASEYIDTDVAVFEKNLQMLKQRISKNFLKNSYSLQKKIDAIIDMSRLRSNLQANLDKINKQIEAFEAQRRIALQLYSDEASYADELLEYQLVLVDKKTSLIQDIAAISTELSHKTNNLRKGISSVFDTKIEALDFFVKHISENKPTWIAIKDAFGSSKVVKQQDSVLQKIDSIQKQFNIADQTTLDQSFIFGQQNSMAKYRKAQQSLNDKASAIDKIINPYSRQLDDALNEILEPRYVETLSRPKDWGTGSPARFAIKNKNGNYIPLKTWPKDWKTGKYYAIDTKRSLVDSLETDIIPNVREMLLAQKNNLTKSSINVSDDTLMALLKLTPEQVNAIKKGDLTFLKKHPIDSSKITPDVEAALIQASEEELILDIYWNDFKEALRKFDEAPADLEARSALVQAYQSLDGYLKGLAEFPEHNINIAAEVINKLGAHPLSQRTRIWGELPTPTKSTVHIALDSNAKYNILDDWKQRHLITPEEQAVLEQAEMIKKALQDTEHNTSFNATQTALNELDPSDPIHALLFDIAIEQRDEAFKELLSRYKIQNVSYERAQFILKKAEEIKSNTYKDVVKTVPKPVVETTPEVVTKMIKDLPTFNIKALDKLIDPVDYSTYKLVTYSIMTRKAHFLNDMLGLDFDGTLLNNFDELVQELTTLKNSLGDITPDKFAKLPEVQQIMSRLTEASTEQPLAVMLMEYSNKSSKLYQILNDEKYISDVAAKGYTTVLQDTKALLERLQSYKRLTQQLSELTKKWGDVYQAAYVDAFVTALGQGRRLTYFTEEVIDDMMNSADLFVRNTCDVETTAMDSLLSKTATELVSKNISEETTQLASEILETLQSGLAHGAVTDVDNWVRLMYLSKHTSDTRINGVFDALLQKAKGRNTVVFDIESTGAKEATSIPFQISGKVLDANGNIIPGSEFNFIMKPPKGVEPLPSVLEKLAQGSNPKQWWLDNVVNATGNNVFDNVENGINAFVQHCNKFSDSGFILAGQNIKNFDITMLRNCASDTDKAFFKNINLSEDVFDSLDYFDLNSFFKIQGDSRVVFKAELMDMFKAAIEAQESALGIKPFTYADMETLSNFKKAYSEVEFNTEVAKKPRVSHYSEDIVVPKAADETLYELEDIFNIEGIITDIKNAWRKPSSYKGKAYFTVTKLNPDSVEQIIKTRLADLSNKGLIDVAPGRNIMQLFNTGVDARHIIVNPKRAISYEIEDFFDMDKLLKSGFSPDQKRLLFKDMCRFTQATSKIKNIRTWLTQDVVDYLKEDARKLLREAANSNEFEINLAKGFYDELDDVSAVAAAVYLYNRAPKDSILKKTFGVTEVFEKADAEPVLKKGAATARTDFDLFGDIAEVRRRIKIANTEYTPTKLQHMSDIDTITEQPRFIYEDDIYGPNYVDIVKAYGDNVLNNITAFNVDKNIYNINTAAVRALRADHLDFAQRVETYLARRPNIRTKVEAAIRSHNNALDAAAVSQILARPNRVQALCDEAYARMGRVYFETKNKIDLSDFEASKNCIVLANRETPHGTYAQIICIKKDVSLKNTDVVLDTRVIKNVDGVDAEGLKLIYECRQRMGAYSKNIGYSHGDLATANTVEVFDDMLYNFGFTKEQIAQLPDVNELTSAGFFKSLNANNSIIGGRKTWEFITNDPNVHYISDPFRQLFYNTRGAVTTHNTKLMAYLNLIYSEHNNIKTSGLFKDLKPEDKVELLKNNPDFGVYYIARSRGKWDKTKSGLVMKEVQIINASSIELAEGLEAHILPRVQAAQAMKAINDFELPPIAQFAKDVSDVFKVAYLGSVGFLIRNFIDSNYKTYASLNGEVSLPKQLKHFFSTMRLVRKHTNIGQEYTARLGKYFNSDFDYKIFYEYCQHIDDSDVVAKIISKFDEKYSVKITRRVEELIERFPKEAVVKVQKDLIEPDLFSVMDVFIRTGPSAGLTKTITNNIPSTVKDGGVLRSFNTLMTEHTPLRFVFNTNETIEQSARLSLFLQDLERGSNIDSAIKNVIKTHFDYSDKSLGMLYTEIVFPFMSFSYKNLDYWLETIYKNPLLVGQLENVLRPVLNYNSIFNPNQEAYQDFDYTFDWSKDITSFEARAPWTMINAARLYHILNGNIVIDTGKDVEHDAGYGSKTNDLYTVFKLSPSVLDAVKTLYNPLDSMSERLLPPFEALQNVMLNMLDDKATTDDLNITTLTNMLPYVDVITQRVGIDQNGLKHNNIFQRIEDAGPLMGMASIFGTTYVPQKDTNYWYDSDYNILGGFKQNYYGKRNYSNPYNTKNPRYTITRMSQNRKPKSTYIPSVKKRLYDYQYSGIQRNLVNRVLVSRIKDYKYYY